MAILPLALVLAALLVAAAAIQLGLPRVIERHAEKRLTENGGHARVHLRAFPATHLLRRRGSSLTVKASGLVTGSAQTGKGGSALDQLDGFDRVDLQVIGMHMGPLDISRVNLTRATPGARYEATLEATVSAARLPLDATATLATANGRITATNVKGSLAGLPVGPLIEALAAAIVASV